MPVAAAREAGLRVRDRLLAEPRVTGARRIGLYAALDDELPTREIFEALAARGSALLLPRVGADRRLEFAAAASWEDLRPGRYGVPEPDPRARPRAPGRGDVVLVPGVAFDEAGHRLGRGAGYYDRSFPPAAPAAPLLIGLGFEFQMVAAVPCGPRDRAVDAICSERRLHWVQP